jgi:DNA-binding NarL/FixJ family response regulator
MPSNERTLYFRVVSSSPNHRLRVLIVEDEAYAREYLIDAINADERMQLAGQASTCSEGLENLAMPHDVVVVDIGLPDGSGIDIIRRSKQLDTGWRLVSTVFGDERTVVSALEAGAEGYILKDNERVTDAIVEVASGHVPLTPSVAAHMLRRFQPQPAQDDGCLTEREAEILLCLARGRSYQEAATELSISYHTVADHVKAIYRKLHVHSRSSAVYKGLQHGLISLPPDF